MHKEEPKISCTTFQKQEPIIKNFTDKINAAKGVQEKARFAEELKKESDVLLACSDYDDRSLNCKNCYTIAKLRKTTVGLIMKAKKLEGKRACERG